MQHLALQVILDEHAALAAVLRTVLRLLEASRRRGAPPDFDMLRAVLLYLDEFPEQRHHRKETELLFPKLRARTPLARSLLNRLDQEHAEGERLVRELEHDLLAFEMIGEPRQASFETAAMRYVRFYFTHMRLEEAQVLPLAERVLRAEDWVELDEAFAGNRDPLTGCAPDAEYRALFQRIFEGLPPPARRGAAIMR